MLQSKICYQITQKYIKVFILLPPSSFSLLECIDLHNQLCGIETFLGTSKLQSLHNLIKSKFNDLSNSSHFGTSSQFICLKVGGKSNKKFYVWIFGC